MNERRITLASPQTSFGVRSSRIHFSPRTVREKWISPPWGSNECVTNEPQRTSAGRLGLHKKDTRKWKESNLTCCNTFDQLMHDLDFLWLLIDVSCQLLKHFPLIGVNTELQPRHKQFKSNYRYTLNFNGKILTPLQIMILILNSHWPFSH